MSGVLSTFLGSQALPLGGGGGGRGGGGEEGGLPTHIGNVWEPIKVEG